MASLLYIEPGKSVYLSGGGKFNVIHGMVSMHGAIIDSDHKELIPYNSKLGIQIFAPSDPSERDPDMLRGKDFLNGVNLTGINFKRHSAVIYVESTFKWDVKPDDFVLNGDNLKSLSTDVGGFVCAGNKMFNAQVLVNFMLNTGKGVTILNLDPAYNGVIWIKTVHAPLFVPIDTITDFDFGYWLGTESSNNDDQYYETLVGLLLTRVDQKKNKVIIIMPFVKMDLFSALENMKHHDSTLLLNRLPVREIGSFFTTYFEKATDHICKFSDFAIALGNDVDQDILSQSLYILYGATVGLGRVPKFTSTNDHPKFYLNYPIAGVKGWGIITFIDRKNMTFTISTPLNISKINCIMFGAVNRKDLSIASPNVEIQEKGFYGRVQNIRGPMREVQKKKKE